MLKFIMMMIQCAIFLTLTTLFLLSCRLDDDFHASPVIVGNDLIIRGFSSLCCFSE